MLFVGWGAGRVQQRHGTPSSWGGSCCVLVYGCSMAQCFWLIMDTSWSLCWHSHHHAPGGAPDAMTGLELATTGFSAVGGH